MPREEGRVEWLSSFEPVGRGTGQQGLTKQIPQTSSPQRTLRASMNKLVLPNITRLYLVLFLQGQTDAQLVNTLCTDNYNKAKFLTVAKGMNSEMPLNKILLHICALLLTTAISH